MFCKSSPVNLFPPIFRYLMEGSPKSDARKGPTSLLEDKSSFSRRYKKPNSGGILERNLLILSSSILKLFGSLGKWGPRRLSPNSRTCKLVKLLRSGTFPEREFLERVRILRLHIREMESGKDPLKKLFCKLRVVKNGREPIQSGMLPEKQLLSRLINWRVLEEESW